MPEGIRKRHAPSCPALADPAARCRCRSGYEASVYNATTRRKIRKTFPTLAAAKAWRADALSALSRGALRAARPLTVRQAAAQLLAGMQSGHVRNRSGDPYKPSVIRGYEQALRLRIHPELGPLNLTDVTRKHLQRLAERMLAQGCAASTIRNAFLPLRVLFRHALEDGDITHNPTSNLRLPAVRCRRDRIATPEEAAALLQALPFPDRAVWMTAFYAGLRLGELRALRWADIDLATGVIRIERSLDHTGQTIEPKSRAGKRTIPIVALLREALVNHRLDHPHAPADALAFGQHGRPFAPSTLYERATRAWKTARLTPIGLHEARHTYASILIAAGVNAKAISTYMGHSSITITYDLYGHLMPGSENEARQLIDAYLQRTTPTPSPSQP